MKRVLSIFSIVVALGFLTGCGGGAAGPAVGNMDGGGMAEGMEGEGIDAFGMDDAPAGDLVGDNTAFMKTTPDNGGGIFPRTDVVSDVPNGMLPPMGENTDGVLLAQAVIPSASSLSPRDRWTGAAIAAKEAGTNKPQGQADVMQSIHNRIGSSAYKCNGIADCVNADDNGDGDPDQYQPVFGNPSGWRNINSPESAARVSGLSVSEIRKADQNINNPKLQQNAASFVGCRTDFHGEREKKDMQPHNGDITRGKGHNYFGNFYASSGYKCKK